MLRVDRLEDVGTHLAELLGETEVHVVGRVQADPGVPMLLVVPGEELGAPRPGVLEGSETLGKVVPVFQGLVLALAVRVVVRRLRPRMRLGDAETAII